MHMTDRGLLALVRYEGLVPDPIFDVKQVWTFGIGHTAAGGAARSRHHAARHAAISMPGSARRSGLPSRPRALEAAVLRAVKVPLARRFRCAGQLSLQHRGHREGRADPAPQCRQSRCSRRGVSELAATGLQSSPAGGGTRAACSAMVRYPAAGSLSGSVDSHGPGGFLAADPSPDRRRGSGAAAAVAAAEAAGLDCTRRAHRAGSPGWPPSFSTMIREGLPTALHSTQLAT